MIPLLKLGPDGRTRPKIKPRICLTVSAAIWWAVCIVAVAALLAVASRGCVPTVIASCSVAEAPVTGIPGFPLGTGSADAGSDRGVSLAAARPSPDREAPPVAAALRESAVSGHANPNVLNAAALTATPSSASATGFREAGAPLSLSRLRPLFDAIRAVESGGNDMAVGDQNRSRGAYQIQKSYWLDSGVPWPYLPGVWDRAKSEAAMIGYWQRYCPRALAELDFETLAKTHNGGPHGATMRATESYWRKVQSRL